LANYGANTALQPSLGATAAGTDIIFACPALNLSKRIMAQGTPIWQYEFRDQTSLPSVGNDASGNYYLSFPQGAAHSYEIQYVFHLRDLKTDEHRALSDAMATYWTNFAHNSDPNVGASVKTQWPTFTGTDKIIGFDVAASGGVKLLGTSFDTDHKCSA